MSRRSILLACALVSCRAASDPGPGGLDAGGAVEATSPSSHPILARLSRLGVELSRGAPRVRRDASGFVPAVSAERRASVRLPLTTEGAFRVADAASDAEIDVALVGGVAAVGHVADGWVVYRGSALGGFDVAHRPTAVGTEDYVVVDRPTARSIAYRVGLVRGIAGLRLVEGVLELVDGDGAPRLRMTVPAVLDDAGRALAHRVDVEGCAVDRSPAGPWGRPPVRPGADSCVVRVAWDARDDAYPVVVDPAWTSTTGNMVAARSEATATTLATKKILVAGGAGTGGVYLSSAELYDPVTQTFAATGSMSARHSEHFAVRLATGDVVIGGGFPAYARNAHLYSASTGTFSDASPMNEYRMEMAGVLLPTGKVLIASGRDYTSTELFDPATKTFTLGASLSVVRRGAAVAPLPSGKVLVAGGENKDFEEHSTAEEYDPTTAKFTSTTGPMTHARLFAKAVPLADGRVAIVGGAGAAAGSTIEIYDPATRTFTLVAAKAAVGRSSLVAVLLEGGLGAGQVLLAGSGSATTELFDPVTQTFRAAGSSVARHDPVAAWTDAGVLLAGGYAGDYLSSAELFAPVPLGSACTKNADCFSGFCADGVCCNEACTGTCRACTAAKKGSGADGTCGFVAAATDPKKSCTQQSCSGGVLTKAKTCDGAGACTGGGTLACAPYACAGTACATSCSTDASCAPGHYCNGTACVPTLAIASACSRDRMCASGHCADGVCCDTACTGTCRACSAAKKGSGADGVCGMIADGADPDAECAADSAYPVSCRSDGTCDGAGACRVYAKAGTACGATTCAGGSVTGKVCNGGGTCESSAVPCAPYLCDATGGGCTTSCASDDDCAADAFCTTASTCATKKKNGGACGAAKECQSGYCVEGLCCNAACTGQCEACDVPSNEGTCVPVTGAPRGSRPACTGDPAICGGACNGSKVAECDYAPTTKGCGSTCVDDAIVDGACDGRGECVAGKPRSCGAYACDDDLGACLVACTDDAQCSKGFRCSSGTCVPNTGSPRCSADGARSVAPDGLETPCGAYRCDDASGICRGVCTESAHCAPTHVCNTATKACEPATTAATDESGGGCSVAPRDATRGGATGWALLAIGAVAATRIGGRRRHRTDR